MSGDFISRETAISKIRDEGVLGGDYDAYEREEDVVDMLNSIPAADVVEVVRGKWEMNSNYPDRLICSECGAQFDCWHWEAKQMHYCPSCGAKMDDNVIQHTESVGNALGALDEVEELSRYIDANKMADELSKVPWYERKDEKQAVRMVKEFPTADVVEVVRCRECKHYNDKLEMYADCVCTIRHYCDGSPIIVGEDDFCSSGKRKDGGQDEAPAGPYDLLYEEGGPDA